MQVRVISTAERVLVTIRPARERPLWPRTGAGAPLGESDGGGSGCVLMALPGTMAAELLLTVHWIRTVVANAPWVALSVRAAGGP